MIVITQWIRYIILFEFLNHVIRDYSLIFHFLFQIINQPVIIRQLTLKNKNKFQVTKYQVT
jgi:hypothetical protein